MNSTSHVLPLVRTIAVKSDKKSIKRFYKQQGYSASFMGYDRCFIYWLNNEIIASVIISYIHESNKEPLLHGLVVSKTFRGMGIGQQLVRSLETDYALLTCFADKSLTEYYTRIGFNVSPQGNNKQIHQSTSLINEKFHQYTQKNNRLVMLIKGVSIGD